MPTKSLKVTHRSIPMGPYKLRPVADQIRGVRVADALVALKVMARSAARTLASKLQATASAAIDHSLNPERLVVRSIYVDQQLELKRQRIRSRGRAAIMRKRSSSVTIELAEQTETQPRNDSRLPAPARPAGGGEAGKGTEKNSQLQATAVPRNSANDSAVVNP